MKNQNTLTDEFFWDNYWSSISLPALIDKRVQWQLALTKVFQVLLPKDPSLKLFEAGCAPGRWLIWFNKVMGHQVAGCDTSSLGIQITKENLKINSTNAELYQADLLSEDLPKSAFDVVLSLGVIEHFSNPDVAVACHLELLKPGGQLILEVPNMAGWLNYKLMKLARMNDLLSHHNLSIMNKKFFNSLAKQFNLEVKFLDYIGGFDPGMVIYNHPYKKRRGRPMILYVLWFLNKLFRLAPNFFTKFNAPFCSHMLLAIFIKPSPVSNKGH